MIDPLAVVYLLGGIVYLFLGGDLIVRGSISVARRHQVSAAVIGATIVAFGTSAPELITSLLAALKGYGEIAVGNVIGSNIANVLLVLGAPALLAPIVFESRGLRRQVLFMMGVTLLFALLCLTGELQRWHGMLLLAILAAAAWLSLSGKLDILDLSPEEEEFERTLGLPGSQRFAWGFIIFGALAMPLGARLTVNGAVVLARQGGIPEEVIAASIIAAGTSLPELSATLIAAMHRQLQMAAGNVIGSNLLNILFVIGVTASISSLPVSASLVHVDIWVMSITALLLTIGVLRGMRISKNAGIAMLLAYAGYMWVIY